jgi:hypothetical protein
MVIMIRNMRGTIKAASIESCYVQPAQRREFVKL